MRAREFIIENGTPQVETKISYTSYQHGQHDGYILAIVDGKKVGYLDFSVYQDQGLIKMVEVEPEYQKMGIGIILVKRLEKEVGKDNIEWGWLTDAGKKLRDKYMSLNENEPIKPKGPDPKVKAWIQKVYDIFPQQFQNNHVIPLGGTGDDQQFALFELVPSFGKRGAVEIKWIQAYPLRAGAGTKAMRILQDMAREDGITLTLYPWDKGTVSQGNLIKFYKKQGFNPLNKSKSMIWEPEGTK